MSPKKITPSPNTPTSAKPRRKPPNALQQAFSANVAAAREEAGLTQDELAKLVGTSQNHIHEIEKEALNVTLMTVGKFARALKKTELEMLTSREPTKS